MIDPAFDEPPRPWRERCSGADMHRGRMLRRIFEEVTSCLSTAVARGHAPSLARNSLRRSLERLPHAVRSLLEEVATGHWTPPDPETIASEAARARGLLARAGLWDPAAAPSPRG